MATNIAGIPPQGALLPCRQSRGGSNTIMKKTYLNPTTMVVQIHHRPLLSGSPYHDQESLDVYEDDVIF